MPTNPEYEHQLAIIPHPRIVEATIMQGGHVLGVVICDANGITRSIVISAKDAMRATRPLEEVVS